jgi:hypothetical protein
MKGMFVTDENQVAKEAILIIGFFWTFVASCCMLYGEMLFAKGQLIFPAGLFVCLYFGVTRSMTTGMIAGIFTACTAEMVFGRSSTNLPVFVIMFILLRLFRAFGDRESIFNQVVLGAVLSAINAGYYLFFENLHLRQGWSLLSGPRATTLFLSSVLTGLVAFPLFIRLLDTVADTACLEPFGTRAGGL